MEDIEISKLLENDNNPRIISEANLEKLKKSLSEFEEMMEIRPIVYNEQSEQVIGGNQRLKALKALGYQTVPSSWVKVVSLSIEEERQFVVKDNASFGAWDWDSLLEEFGTDELSDWGVDIPNLGDLEKVGKVNNLDDDEWVGMPEFEGKDDPLQIVVKFDSEKERKEFADKMNIKFTYSKEGTKSWSTWYPYKEKGDWKSKKYE